MTAEEQYLGAVLLHPERYFEHNVRPEDFVSFRCQKLYDAIGKTLDRGDRVDPGVLLHETDLDRGWFAGLTSEPVINVKRLSELVIENGKKYRLSKLVREAGERLESDTTAGVLEFIETGLSDIAEGRDDDLVMTGDLVDKMVTEFQRRYENKGEIPGITSGLSDLDDLLLGFEKARYYVVGARPSDGKSALLLNLAIAAKDAQHSPGFLSLESSRIETMERSFASVGGIDMGALRKGKLSSAMLHDMGVAADWISGNSFPLADKPNMYLSDLKARARRMVRVMGCDILFVDYVQLVQMPGELTDYERISRVSVALKDLSRELDIPIVVAAQLNRGAEDGKNRKPRLSEFKGTGQIEQDADAAILIYRRVKDNEEQFYLCVEKNRDGGTGDVHVYFDKARMRFRGFAHE